MIRLRRRSVLLLVPLLAPLPGAHRMPLSDPAPPVAVSRNMLLVAR